MSRNGKTWIKRNYRKCSGCRRCEIACTLHHEGKIWPEASRIRIFMIIPGVEIPHLCFQCTNYPCVEACPSHALLVNSKTGAVNVVVSECTGCSLCIDACPGNVPHLHPEENYIVICDLCDGKPKCVDVCREGRWNTLALVPREREASHKTLAKTPQQLTRETARRILGARITKEILD